MPTQVGRVIQAVAMAVGRKNQDLLEDLVRWSRPPDGGDTDPTGDTIIRYGKRPKTRCHYRFAELVADYLYAQGKVRDRRLLADAQKILSSVLLDQIAKRYERPVGTDPAYHGALDQYVGAYAVARRETGDDSYHQELLILELNGEKERKAYASYITMSVIFRGVWHLMGNSLCVATTGYREHRRHDIADIFLARDMSNPQLMGGFLGGITTRGGLPVVMPIIATRVKVRTDHIATVGHGSDGSIRKAFKEAFRHKRGNVFSGTKQAKVLDDLHAEALPRVIVRPEAFTARFSRMPPVPMRELSAFCEAAAKEKSIK